ncbi:MAG: alpha-amylase/4-alpha-glucanotransferase domain-containing protein [Burkholderiales bacterium]
MTAPVALLLGVHAHQPVGNFPEVIDDAHARCYKPFLETLVQYPEFKFTIHFSGWLLQYLFDHFPQDMALLKVMVERGQAEIFGGGDTEPVLAAIPARDRVGQIERLSARTRHLLGATPQGAWLTERVWESQVVPALVDAGISMVTVDDYHFLCAGKVHGELAGYYTTEEEDRRLDLFPISEGLRYRLPFATAPEAVAYIEGMAQDSHRAAAIYFDDIEKFGIWPETHEWVYGKGWLRQFIEGVLASRGVHTMHFGAYRESERTRGVIYLPATSYIEMNEWTLPAPQAHRYARLVENEKAGGNYEQDKPFLRGGIWRNFLMRYSESNWMHRRMLSLSRRVDTLPPAQRSLRIVELLYEAQANDAYWHGLFGGLYLPHLRRAVYNAIVGLEAELNTLSPNPARQSEDLDFDGNEEIFLQNGMLQIVVREDNDAAIIEFDAYSLQHNFADTLRRREEHYYRKMSQADQSHAQGEGIASAHDRVRFKHPVSAQDLQPDARPRALFVDRWVTEQLAVQPEYVLSALEPEEVIAFQAEVPGGYVRKHYELTDNRLLVKYVARSDSRARLEAQLNIAMPSCDGFLGRYVFEGQVPGGFGQALELDSMSTIMLEDGVLGGSIEILCSRPAKLRAAPHHTVSQSEDGFEKIMQAVTLDLVWEMEPGESDLLIAIEVSPEARRRVPGPVAVATRVV